MAKKSKEKKQKKNTKDNVLNLDNEIVIGIKTLPEPQISKKQKKQLQKKKQNKNQRINESTKKKKSNKNTKQNTKNKKQNTKNSMQTLEKENRKNSSKSTTKKTRQTTNKNAKGNKQKNTKVKPKVEENNFDEMNLEILEIPNVTNQNKRQMEKQQAMAKKKRKIVFRIVKYTTLLAIVIGGGIYFMLSPFFNIGEITVAGNEKLTSEELISLSGIQLEVNTFTLRTNQIEEAIKQNAYVEQVKIKRSLPDKVEIQIVERKPRFMLTFANAYIYINNQGYMLEVAQNPIVAPIITGFLTPEEDIHVGNRLCTEDLQRLEYALQIMKSAEANGIGNKVTKINIADKQDYVLELKDEKKTVHIGDSSNLSTKMLYIISIIEENKKVEGEIFVNTDLSNKGAIFRKKI